MSQIIRVPYRIRDIFRPYHAMDKRYALTIAHRRAGKTVARINRLVRAAVECQLQDPRFGYLAPSFVMAKDIAWLYLKRYAPQLPGLKINESELAVVIPHNNATIRLYGAENAQRMNGIYFDGICIDEAQLIPKSVLGEIIMPCLADRKGWLDITGKPRGWQNMLGELYKLALNDPDWFVQVLKASETGILDDDELKAQHKLMSDDEYEQEFECSFEAAIGGGVYSKWMQTALEQKRINDRVAHDSKYPVYTAWDLGYGDATVIWFYQVGPKEVLLIDYYEYSGEGMAYYCDILNAKPYTYAKHFVPHDAAFKLQAANGRSMVEQAWDKGVKLTVMPETGHKDCIEAGRVTLPRCWFHATKCHAGIEALRNYHYEWDEKMRMYREKPRHDWSSHASRAFELCARVWREKVVTTGQLAARKQEAEFFRRRRENDVDKNTDPYRVRPI